MKLIAHKYSNINTTDVLYYVSWNKLYRFLFTSITSRSTTYLLFSFWCFFFFFGEFFLLTLFNFSTISDAIPSHYFFNTKNHVVFWLNSSSAKLTDTMSFYHLFNPCAFNFLFKLEIPHSYNKTRFEVFLDKWFFIVVLYLLLMPFGSIV